MESTQSPSLALPFGPRGVLQNISNGGSVQGGPASVSHQPVTLSRASLSDTILFASPPVDAWCRRDSRNRLGGHAALWSGSEDVLTMQGLAVIKSGWLCANHP